jgi:ATP synthase protein I
MVDRPPGKDPREPGASLSSDASRGETTDDAALAERLKHLGASLEAHPSAVKPETSRGRSPGYAQAVKVASEFVAGIIVGGGIGWLIDRAAGTSPWALIVFLFLGFAAGVLNVLRAEGVVAEAGIRSSVERTRSGSTSDETED